MEKYFMPKMGVDVSVNHKYIDVHRDGKLIFTTNHGESFNVFDANAFAIIENNKRDYGEAKITFFILGEYNELKKSGFKIKDNSKVFNDELLEHKEVIIPGVYSSFIYSYEYDLIISDLFDEIIYDKENKVFHVAKNLNTIEGLARFYGELNIDGFLLNEQMYCPELDLEIYVNPLDFESSLKKNKPKIEKEMRKKKKELIIKEFVNFEREAYLKRKK